VRERPRVFIHVGAPKTGTTYLQGILHANRAALRRAGVLYPGTQHAHFWASQDLRGTTFQGSLDRHVPGAWPRLVGEVRAWPGESLIDHESLGAASRPTIVRALADLSFAEVHIVVTARDLARQLPATWQERLKNRSSETFAEFLASVQADCGRRNQSARRFWANHDVPAILGRWGRDLPPKRVHVVTVPPADAEPGLLWRRFAGLLGLDPDAYPSNRPRGANVSLGAAEAAVLRRFNGLIRNEDIPWPVYARVVKQDLAPLLAARGGAPIELPEPAHAWAVRWSESAVERLLHADYDVVGHLDDLISRIRPTGLDPDAAPADEQIEAAEAAMVRLLSIVADSPRGQSAVRRSQRGAVARRTEDLVARVQVLGVLRDAYRRR
jgi:hypothetical protein